MPAFAVASGPFLHGFRYSPLGLPSHNLRCLGEAMGGTLAAGMFTWDAASNRWAPLGGWPRHLWWLRFLLAVRDATRGTRWEAVGDLAYMERAYAWWLQNTTIEERVRFCQNPDVGRIVCALLRTGNPVDCRLGRNVRRMAALLPRSLLGCAQLDAGPWYGNRRSGTALRCVLSQADGVVAFALESETVHHLLLAQYGSRLREVNAPLLGRTETATDRGRFPLL